MEFPEGPPLSKLLYRLKSRFPHSLRLYRRLRHAGQKCAKEWEHAREERNGAPSLRRIARTAKRTLGPREKVLVLPDLPSHKSVLQKICLELGKGVTDIPQGSVVLGVQYAHATYSAELSKHLENAGSAVRILNSTCNDISKVRVDATMSRVFDYSTRVDPTTFSDEMVEKSNLNARHDGRIISGPVQSPNPDCVYQKVIDNQVSDDLVLDIRVPIIGQHIPLVYRKFRPLFDRFSNTNSHVELAVVEEVLTTDELKLLHNFGSAMGLDFGELDVLRDRGDSKIYVVDVNNTPNGPPNNLPEKDGRLALQLLADSFHVNFLG